MVTGTVRDPSDSEREEEEKSVRQLRTRKEGIKLEEHGTMAEKRHSQEGQLLPRA